MYAQYTVEVKNRKVVQEFMRENGIPTTVHYPSIIPAQKAFEHLNDNQINKYPIAFEKSKSFKFANAPIYTFRRARIGN